MNNLKNISGTPGVTMIVPVYNGKSTLPALLDSLEKLDYRGETEFIFVDDGSTDDSGEYCRSRGYNVIRQVNQGPGIARNSGAKVARGEILVFTDADCILDEDFITELIKPLLDSDIVGAQGVFYSKQSNLVARFIQVEVQERINREKRADNFDWVATYAACYRKDVFLDNGGFSDIYSAEDAEFSMRLARKGYKMVLVPSAKCQHINYENFFKFLRFKYKRAYWIIWLYKKFPNMIVEDKMTPSSRKSMMILMMGAILLLVLGIFWKWCFFAGEMMLLLFLASTIPFALKAWKLDKTIALLSPFFLCARTLSYIFGFGKGVIDYLRGIQTVKKSAAK